MKNKNQCNKKTVFVNKALDLKEVVSPKKIIFWLKKKKYSDISDFLLH